MSIGDLNAAFVLMFISRGAATRNTGAGYLAVCYVSWRHVVLKTVCMAVNVHGCFYMPVIFCLS